MKLLAYSEWVLGTFKRCLRTGSHARQHLWLSGTSTLQVSVLATDSMKRTLSAQAGQPDGADAASTADCALPTMPSAAPGQPGGSPIPNPSSSSGGGAASEAAPLEARRTSQDAARPPTRPAGSGGPLNGRAPGAPAGGAAGNPKSPFVVGPVVAAMGDADDVSTGTPGTPSSTPSVNAETVRPQGMGPSGTSCSTQQPSTCVQYTVVRVMSCGVAALGGTREVRTGTPGTLSRPAFCAGAVRVRASIARACGVHPSYTRTVEGRTTGMMLSSPLLKAGQSWPIAHSLVHVLVRERLSGLLSQACPQDWESLRA